MNINIFFTFLFKAALVLSIAAWAALSACSSTAEFSSGFPEHKAAAQSNQANLQTTDAAQKDFDFLQSLGDVCIYKNIYDRDNPDRKRLYELMNAGYPKEISLEEGVAIFNKFAQCNDTGKTQPPLRAEEVVASIRDWVCEYDRDVKDKKSCAEFWKIAETGKLPKGAFIDNGGAGRVAYKGYDVDAWQMDLFIRLDKYRRDIKGAPYFKRIIRLNYLSSKPAQKP